MSLNYLSQYNREIRDWLTKVFAFAAAIPRESLARRDCPVCEAADSQFFANNDHLNYERCRACSLVFMNPAPDASAVDKGFTGGDELLMEYFEIIRKYQSEPSGIPDPTNDSKLKDIYQFKQSGLLLDVGCSAGDFLHKAKHFYRVEGLEINPRTAVLAERHFKVHKKPLGELSLAPVYDIVTLHQILYGVPDPAGLFRDIFRVLRSDGLLYVNTPNADSYAMALYRGKSNHLYGYSTLNVFNERALTELARRSGFKILAYRTEWLDIYLTDLMAFLDHPEQFIHKRNCQIQDYEDKIRREDLFQRTLIGDVGNRGNYLVAVLGKSDTPVHTNGTRV